MSGERVALASNADLRFQAPRQGGGDVSTSSANVGTVVQGELDLFVLSYTGSAYDAWKGADSEVLINSNSNTVTATTSLFALGAGVAAGLALGFWGDISGTLIFDRVLSEGERIEVRDALIAYCGVTP